METEKESKELSGIVYSHYSKINREGEHFIPKHTLSYQITGSLILTDGNKEYKSHDGSFRLIRKNQLLKFVKQPPTDGEFKSLTIYLSQQTLKNFSLEYGITTDKKESYNPVLELKTSPLLKDYINSLLTYHQTNNLKSQQLIELKLKEGILLLLQTTPELKNILFNFNEPHKIDLEAFMNKNFHFNVNLERFAYLTGRSLATFRRDFKKIFDSTPNRWLQRRRLQEAYYLITKKGKPASDIYLDLGFNDLSHFSYAFKKQFGEAPSKISSL